MSLPARDGSSSYIQSAQTRFVVYRVCFARQEETDLAVQVLSHDSDRKPKLPPNRLSTDSLYNDLFRFPIKTDDNIFIR